jgi:hypothetical protein
MNTLHNNFDTIEKLIFEEGVRIRTIDIHPELDLMLVILNTTAVLHIKISSYPTLAKAKKEILLKYELIADGVGIHWSLLDEDLSLKGFLQDELKNILKVDNKQKSYAA